MSKALITMQARVVDAVQGRKERGATMVEYGLMLALIAVVCIVAVTAIGTSLNGVFENIATDLGAVF